MKIEQLRDVLHWTEAYHKELHDCLQHCQSAADSERVKLLLQYLADHEEQIAAGLKRFETQANLNALDTWCNEYMKKQPMGHELGAAVSLSKLSTAEIIQYIVQQHDVLIGLYRHLQSQIPADNAAALLQDLVDMENHEAMQMVKNYEELEDL